MELPAWVLEYIQRYEAPATGKVTIVLERYQGGITHCEIGGSVRLKPTPKT